MLPDDPITDTAADKLSSALARHGGVVALFDDQDRLHWANGRFRAAFGLGPVDFPTWAGMMTMNHATATGTAIQTEHFDSWLSSALSRRGKQPYRQFETDLHDGRWLLMTETTDTEGWMLCVGLDISDLGRDHRALRMARDVALRASQVDSLTGLANREAVLSNLQIALAIDPGRTSVAVIDLDRFKAINDRYGHAAGDAVLRDFAGRLQGDRHVTDLCGRIGGEEFLLVLRDTDLPSASEAIERLLAAVRRSRPLTTAPTFGYTASVGLAQARPGERAEDLMIRADAALYRAKRTGRDRCLVDG